jgi:hypothetical protein
MQTSGSAREARRRPDLDLLLGPFETATAETDTSQTEGSTPEDVELTEASEPPMWREDG